MQAKPAFVDTFASFRASVRDGDIIIPKIAPSEPLKAECDHFLECIQSGTPPLTGGREGLAVVRALEAIERSLRQGGREERVGAMIPLVDLAAQHREIADEVDLRIRVASSPARRSSSATRSRSSSESSRHSSAFGTASASPTAPTRSSSRCVRRGSAPGDEVIVPANTFVATAFAVVRAGATPVFVDCDPVHHLIDVAKLAARTAHEGHRRGAPVRPGGPHGGARRRGTSCHAARGRGASAWCHTARAPGRDPRPRRGDELLPGEESRRLRRRRRGADGIRRCRGEGAGASEITAARRSTTTRCSA